VAATCVDRLSERAVRIAPHLQARVAAIAAMPAAKSHWHAQCDAYQILPADTLFTAAPVQLTLSLQALLSRRGVRTLCEQCGEEIINEREVQRAGRLLCRSCAGDTYYQCGACEMRS